MGVSLLLVVGPASEDLKVSSNPAGVKHPVGFNRNWGAQVNLALCEKARKTRQLAIFPLATTTVGWVPDRTPEAEAKRRTRSEAQSCAGGLPTDNAAKGESQSWRWARFLTLC